RNIRYTFRVCSATVKCGKYVDMGLTQQQNLASVTNFSSSRIRRTYNERICCCQNAEHGRILNREGRRHKTSGAERHRRPDVVATAVVGWHGLAEFSRAKVGCIDPAPKPAHERA